MSKVKKKEALSLEEKLKQALVPVDEQPYEVPENWCWTYLTSGFCECKDNFRKPINASGRAEREGDIPYYGATGQVGWIDDYLTDEQLVLVGEDGAPFLDTIKDKAYMIEGKAWVNNHAHILKSYYGEIGNKYILNYLNSFNYRGYVNGTTRLKLTQASMNTIPVPMPPLAEQQRIVEQIESLFVKLDEAQCKLESALEESEIRRTATLNEAFKGELTKGWREKHKSCKNTVIEAVKLYSNTLSNKDKKFIAEGQAELNPIEMSGDIVWYETKIGAISRVTNGSTPSRQCEQYWNGDIPWVSSGEVRNNIIDVTEERITQEGYDSSSVKLLPKGTVLIAMIGEGKTRGQSAILNIEATTNQNIAAIVIEHGQINSKFLWYWLQKGYKKNREKGAGSGPQALNCQRVRELDMIVPPIEEQDAIVEIIDELMQKEMQVIETISEVIDKISLIKKFILAKAFRGELGANNPDEESAVELLRSILEQEE